MKTYTTEYVKASGLFEGYREFWDALIESDPPWTWGSAMHTLIRPEYLLGVLQDEVEVGDGKGVLLLGGGWVRWEVMKDRIWKVMLERKLVDLET